MAFVLRRPFAVSSGLKQLGKSSTSSVRLFHNTPLKSSSWLASSKQSFTKPNRSEALSKHRSVFQNAFRRNYQQQAYRAPSTQGWGGRIAYGAAIVGGTVLATNLIFNRETREDGGMPMFERDYLNQTFLHTGLGVGIIGIAARALHNSGWSYRLMATNPWLVIGGGLALSIGTMMGTRATSPDNYVMKYGFWTAFNITQAACLTPIMFMHPALLARAGIYTIGMMGSIAFVGATAKQEKYLYLGGPLLAGVVLVAMSGLAPLVIPATAARTLMWSERIWLYGGLAVFGGFTLYDVQKILYHARLAQQGVIQKDVVNESISLELDFLNIFIRMVQILGMSGRNRK